MPTMGIIIDMNRRALLLQKPSGAIMIAGPLSERERKLYNGFLKVAHTILKVDPREHWFRVPLKELKRVLKVQERDKDNTRLMRVMKAMSQVMIEYNLFKKGREIKGFAHLLDNVYFERLPSGQTIVRFSIPEMIRLAMLRQSELGFYANINLKAIKDFNSKYAIILYELVCDYSGVSIPQMDIATFRKVFGIENKYRDTKDLKRWVLDVACREINKSPKVAFTVKYELIKEGNRYAYIKFRHRKKSGKDLKPSDPDPGLETPAQTGSRKGTLQPLGEILGSMMGQKNFCTEKKF